MRKIATKITRVNGPYITSPTLADSLAIDTCTPGVPIFYLGETSFETVKVLNRLNIFIRAI